MNTRIRWLGLSLLIVILGLATIPAAQPVDAASPGQTTPVVERWRGKIAVQGSLNTTIISFGALPGTMRESYTIDFDLQVYEGGFVNGDVTTTFSSLSFEQIGNICGFFLKCRVGVTLGNPVAHTFVEGERTLSTSGQPELHLKKEIEISPGSYVVSTSLGSYSTTATEDLYADVLPAAPFKITPYQLGRPPIAEPIRPIIKDGVVDYTFQGQLIGYGEEPLLELDPELLERSVFLAQVPVEDTFDANVDWNSADESGWLSWQFAQEPVERVGPTRSTRLPKQVQVGPPAPGQKTLVVQAQNTLGKDSAPQTSRVTVAPPVQAPQTRTSAVTGQKQGDIVAYKFNFKFPEPAFKAEIPRVPEGVPFFGGGALGIPNTQASGEVDVKSTGEGYAKATVETGFKAMKSDVKGGVSVRTKVMLDAAGVSFPEGEFEVKLAGKLKGEEALIVLVPAVGAWVNKVATAFPAALAVINKAKFVLEAEPKISVLVKLKDENGDIAFVKGQAKPGLGIKASIVLDLIKDVMSATGSVGGDVTLILQFPAPYFDAAEIKLLASAQIVLYHWAYSGEKSVTARLSPNGLSGALPSAADAVDMATSQDADWTLMARPYLDDPDYNLWSGRSVVPQAERYGPTDVELVQNIYPQANPALAVRAGAGRNETAMVWSYERPGLPQLASQELMYSPGSFQRELTDDQVADFHPKLVYLPNGKTMLLWQRLDTSAPPDFNTDPQGYLSHLQIAAAPFNIDSSADPVPQMLTSGSLNYRHQLASTDTGALATWIINSSNQILGDSAHPDQIVYARYTLDGNGENGSWSTPAPILPSIAGLVDYHLATAGTHAAVVYSQDRDGDMATDSDHELFVTRLEQAGWSTPQQLTTNSVADEAPQLALDTAGSPLLVWRQAGALRYTSGGWSAASTPLVLPEAAERSDYELVRADDGSMALTWQEIEPGDTRVGYAIFDAQNGRWGDARSVATNPVTTTAATTMANNITAALAPTSEIVENSRDRLYLGYQLAAVEPVTRTVDDITVPNALQLGAQSLHLASVPIGTNLQLLPVDLKVLPGSPLQVQAVIRNTGDLATPAGVPVVLKSQDAEFETTPLVTRTLPLLSAGSAVTLTLPVTGSSIGERFGVEIDPPVDFFTRVLRETTYSDNEAFLGAEMAIAPRATDYTTTGAAAKAVVTQSGALYNSMVVSSTLRLGSPTGPVISTANIGFPITRTNEISASSFISSTLLGPGSHQLYWQVDPEGSLGEANVENNLTSTTVNIYPDLTTDAALIGWSRAPGATVPISLRVENQGNWTSSAGTIAVYDSWPGRVGSHQLGTLLVPAIAAGSYAELIGELALTGLPAAESGLTRIVVQLDPGNTQPELNENNNVVFAGTIGDGLPPQPDQHILYLPQVRR